MIGIKGGGEKMKNQIRKLRIEAKLTQNKLAEKMGYKSQSIATMWESGERKVPSEKIPQLANALGCGINDLFDPEETQKIRKGGEEE